MPIREWRCPICGKITPWLQKGKDKKKDRPKKCKYCGCKDIYLVEPSLPAGIIIR